jgi:hypothetical protein
LKWNPPTISGKIHIVGNPPFGKQSSLCRKFIKHASKFANTVSLILPLSFKKASNVQAIPEWFHLIEERILPVGSFKHKGVDKNIPSVFQIWEKRNFRRIGSEENETPRNFQFDKKNANVAIVRVGSNAGLIKISTGFDISKLNKNTHYFLTVDKQLFIKLSKIKTMFIKGAVWTRGAKSIAKPELIKQINILTSL